MKNWQEYVGKNRRKNLPNKSEIIMYMYVSTSEIYLIASSLPVSSWKKNIYKTKQKHWSSYEKQIKSLKQRKLPNKYRKPLEKNRKKIMSHTELKIEMYSGGKRNKKIYKK